MTAYKIIATGSSGNAVIYHEEILVDLGVGITKIKPHLGGIQYLLLTHKHGDHFNLNTILTVAALKPELMIIGHEEVIGVLDDYGIKNIHAIPSNEWLRIGEYTIASFDLKHDARNIGYRILKPIFKEEKYIKDYKIFHATDTYDLEEVEAKQYDLYMVEFNHAEEMINENITKKQSAGKYAYEINARENHQSNERAVQWLEKNDTEHSKVVALHPSSTNNSPEIIEGWTKKWKQ